MTTNYINLSLFFAFAASYPNVEFLVFFVLPVKAKWLALLDGILFASSIFDSVRYGVTVSAVYFSDAVCAVLALLNFFVFFLMTRNLKRYTYKEIHRKRTYRREVHQAGAGPRHKCAICGRTELDGENLEFRYCSKCKGNYEYCQDHLFTHEHVK